MNFSVRDVSGFKYDPLEMYPITGLLLVCHLADVDPSGGPMTFHPTGRVHRVAKEAIAGHFCAHHSSHHVTCVDAYPDLEREGKSYIYFRDEKGDIQSSYDGSEPISLDKPFVKCIILSSYVLSMISMYNIYHTPKISWAQAK